MLQDEASRNRKADVFSLGCVFIEIFTVLAGCSLEEFMEHRRADADRVASAGVPNRLAWVRRLLPLLRVEQRDIIWITAYMIALDPESRPPAVEVWKYARSMTRGDKNGARIFCGVCCEQSYLLHRSDEARELREESQAPSMAFRHEESDFSPRSRRQERIAVHVF